MKKRKICVVTGTRAEYGLLYWLMKEIQNDDELQLQLIVTGAHLSPEFGLTYKIIEKDGFNIDEKIEILLSSDTPVAIIKSMGVELISFADALNRLKPDIMVVLGDRYEILVAVEAALVINIPVAHIHGGELSEGVIDDEIRHAISKMSLLHFTATETYRKRVIQLGEDPSRVFNVGAIGIDNIKRLKLLDRSEFEKSCGYQMKKINFLVTYHPVTLRNEDPSKEINELLIALDNYDDAGIIFTQTNADTRGRTINTIIQGYVDKNKDRMIMIDTMGQLLYLSAIKHIDAVIGNSSSGIIEVPSFHKPTVNIGPRQRGRIKAKSVITCKEEHEDIKSAIDLALSESFKRSIENLVSPFGDGGTAEKIVSILKTCDISPNSIMKRFYDMGFEE